MEALVFLLLIVIAVCFVVPLVAIVKATGALRSVKDFETRLRSLEAEMQMLKHPSGRTNRADICGKRGNGNGRRRAFRFAGDCTAFADRALFGSAAIARGGHNCCDICRAARASSTADCQAASAGAFTAGN